jgi:putative flippase GtrA
MKIALRYTIFAIIATVANIFAQDISLRMYNGLYHVGLSVMVGTIIGLGVKYVLDKKYIFRFQANNAIHDARTFVLYTAMGVVTTAIFWGFEFGFDYLFQSKTWRYTGAVIGLAIGYFIKYLLDKRFVFVTSEA